MDESESPRVRYIIVPDIKGSSKLGNAAKGRARKDLRGLLVESLRKTGIDAKLLEPFGDRGDGFIVTVRTSDEITKLDLLKTFVPSLRQLLDRHNTDNPDRRLQVRLSIHFGDVHKEDSSWYGQAVDLACKLVDSAILRNLFEDSTESLIVAISEDVHKTTVRQGYPGIDPTEFHSLIPVETADGTSIGYVYLKSGA
jgi:hypothetical protein